MSDFDAEYARLVMESKIAVNKKKAAQRTDGIIWWSSLVVWISLMLTLIAVVAVK